MEYLKINQTQIQGVDQHVEFHTAFQSKPTKSRNTNVNFDCRFYHTQTPDFVSSVHTKKNHLDELCDSFLSRKQNWMNISINPKPLSERNPCRWLRPPFAWTWLAWLAWLSASEVSSNPIRGYLHVVRGYPEQIRGYQPPYFLRCWWNKRFDTKIHTSIRVDEVMKWWNQWNSRTPVGPHRKKNRPYLFQWKCCDNGMVPLSPEPPYFQLFRGAKAHWSLVRTWRSNCSKPISTIHKRHVFKE